MALYSVPQPIRMRTGTVCFWEVGINPFITVTRALPSCVPWLSVLSFNPLTTDDAFWRCQFLAACYQLAQSVLKTGEVVVSCPDVKIVWWTTYAVLVPIFWNHRDVTSTGLWIQKRSSKQWTPRQPTSAPFDRYNSLVNTQHTAARVARSMSISLVDRWHAMWNAIFDDVKC